MEALFITPIREWGSIEGIQEEKTAVLPGQSQAGMFADVFRNAVEQVQVSQADVEHKQYLLATGQLDDAHTLPIAEAKAALSLDVLISLRNKAMESYNELMKMSV
ncbi:MAG: flagellar hook-basal body complex protein FliE [Clostridium sp.]|nr:flagellar hook-basal body complex protein FliE [Clostridium sp.]MCI6138803.1 flagellar hook-basal body complex protein FliE [Clostridium sp.]